MQTKVFFLWNYSLHYSLFLEECSSDWTTSLSSFTNALAFFERPSWPLISQNLNICGYFQLGEGHPEIRHWSGNRLAAVWTQPAACVLWIITWSRNRIQKQANSAQSRMHIWLQDVDAGAERRAKSISRQRKLEIIRLRMMESDTSGFLLSNLRARLLETPQSLRLVSVWGPLAFSGFEGDTCLWFGPSVVKLIIAN